MKHLDDAHDQVDLVIATALRERKPVRQSEFLTVLLPAIFPPHKEGAEIVDNALSFCSSSSLDFFEVL